MSYLVDIFPQAWKGGLPSTPYISVGTQERHGALAAGSCRVFTRAASTVLFDNAIYLWSELPWTFVLTSFVVEATPTPICQVLAADYPNHESVRRTLQRTGTYTNYMTNLDRNGLIAIAIHGIVDSKHLLSLLLLERKAQPLSAASWRQAVTDHPPAKTPKRQNAV